MEARTDANIGPEGVSVVIPALNEEGEVVINGISCQEQIQHGTGTRPRHLAEILAEALL